MMKLKKLALATSIALSAMAAAGTAQAGALASSVLDITNFTIFKNGAQVDRNDFFPGANGLTISNTADISTSLGAVSLAPPGLVGAGEDLDLAPVRLGDAAPAYANNAYTAFGSPPGSTFTLADQSQFGSPIANVPDPANPGETLDPTASASHAAYVSLLDENLGSSTANNGLNSSFEFVLGEGGALDFAFDARAYLEAFTVADAAFPTASSASFGLVFTLVDLGGGHGPAGATIVNWEPDGDNNLTSASAFGLDAESDPFDLTQAVSRIAPVNGSSLGVGVNPGVEFNSSWSATTIALLADNDYLLTIRSNSLADAREVEAVPEPATLALMGLGILGLGLSRRRRA